MQKQSVFNLFCLMDLISSQTTRKLPSTVTSGETTMTLMTHGVVLQASLNSMDRIIPTLLRLQDLEISTILTW